MEDDRVALLEEQLAQAKLIAEEADKKYEEVVGPSSFHYHSIRNEAISLKISKEEKLKPKIQDWKYIGNIKDSMDFAVQLDSGISEIFTF